MAVADDPARSQSMIVLGAGTVTCHNQASKGCLGLLQKTSPQTTPKTREGADESADISADEHTDGTACESAD
jgi:hypothetical protein